MGVIFESTGRGGSGAHSAVQGTQEGREVHRTEVCIPLTYFQRPVGGLWMQPIARHVVLHSPAKVRSPSPRAFLTTQPTNVL